MIGSFSITVRARATTISTISLSGVATVAGHLKVSFGGTLTMSSVVYDVLALTHAWVYNLNTEAVSEYTNFGFNSMAVVGGVTFACGRGGLFTLNGASDNGALINPTMTLGTTDFGVVGEREATRKKSVDVIYVSGVSPRPVNVTCATTDGTFNYLTSSAPTALSNAVATPGKGLRARYWAVSVASTGGAPLEVDAVDLMIVTTKRRVGL